MAKCSYCHDSAGFFHKTCADCALLLKKVGELLGNTSFGEFLDGLAATGVKKDRIKTFLHADPTGEGSFYDRITADMANDLIQGMGIEGHQTPEDVKRLREGMAQAED